MEQQVRIALESTSCGRREKTNNEEIFFVPAQQQSKLQQRQKRIPKKLPYTHAER
jgi:hypothetical protein